MKLLLNASCSTTALLIVLLALGCGSLTTAQAGDNTALRIGLVRFRGMEHRTGSAEGYLLVYSATDEFSDGDLVFNAHSSYLIYTTDGKSFKSVENHMSRSDEIPERVSLPAGSYIVEARSANNGYVRVRVVIKPSRLTLLELDSGHKESSSGIARN
jgi:hypothetical protein